jgi:hypothetical protein
MSKPDWVVRRFARFLLPDMFLAPIADPMVAAVETPHCEESDGYTGGSSGRAELKRLADIAQLEQFVCEETDAMDGIVSLLHDVSLGIWRLVLIRRPTPLGGVRGGHVLG